MTKTTINIGRRRRRVGVDASTPKHYNKIERRIERGKAFRTKLGRTILKAQIDVALKRDGAANSHEARRMVRR